METCPYCKEQFEVEVPSAFFGFETLNFTCLYCGREFESEQLPKIVWKRDGLSGCYYTTLVPKHTKVDGEQYQRFDYYDYLKEKRNERG